MSRDVRHFVKAGVSIGVDVRETEENGQVARIALAFTNRQDSYSRRAARHHIDLRFDADDSTLRSLGLGRNVYQLPYDGAKPRQEIILPLIKLLEQQLKLREKSHLFEGSISEMKMLTSLFARAERNKQRIAQSVCLD